MGAECWQASCRAGFHGGVGGSVDRIPLRLSIRVENDERSRTPDAACVSGTRLAAQGEASPSTFRFREDGSPGPVTGRFDPWQLGLWCRLLKGLLFVVLLPTRSLGGKEGGGAGAETWGSCWFP